MGNLDGIMLSILPPFLLLAVGGFARKLGWLRAEADASLSMVTIRILYPCFIFYHILGSGEVSVGASTILTPVFGFLSIALGFGLAWGVSKIFRIGEGAQTFRFCTGIFNYGFIAIPVAHSLFGPEIVVRIILFNLGVEVGIWTLGIFVLTAGKFSFKGLINPPVVSVLLALLLQSLGGRTFVPSFAWEVVEMIGNCSIPMGLMLIGGSFYELISGFRFSAGYRVEIAALLVRNLIFPCLVLTYVAWGPIPMGMEWMRQILVVQAAMPAGIFALVIVGSYSADRSIAMLSILVTMIASLVTLPIWLFIGVKLI